MVNAQETVPQGPPTMQEVPQEKTVLVFGGNGLIGAETVEKLIPKGYNVICVSRGNWYWDSDSRIRPFVTHFSCDRKLGLRECKHLTDHLYKLQKKGITLEAVIDFSGYNPEVVRDTLITIDGTYKLYVYVSTDSVYEVCTLPPVPKPSKETDARRPESPTERERLAVKDSYGHRKLMCEEVIREMRDKRDINYVIFRLPDVLGPRDNTDRLWTYQMWVQFYDYIKQPIMVPPQAVGFATSFVYVKDVANQIRDVITEPGKALNEVFNLGLVEPLSLTDFVSAIAKELKVKNVEFDFTDDPEAFALFPSVTRGPVNIEKAQNVLKWKPTTLTEVMKETVSFYNGAYRRFPVERQEAIDNLLAYVVPSENKEAFTNAVEAFSYLGGDVKSHPNEEL